MLTENDVTWIADNRSDITASRTESITLTHTTEGAADPYTGEPAVTTTLETVYAVWKEFKAASDGDIRIIGGIELRAGDVAVTLPSTTVMTDITKITRGGADYALIAYDERGIGGKNRYECVVRRVT
jgi:hypothetical protein